MGGKQSGYPAQEHQVWIVNPSPGCPNTTITFEGSIFDVNGDPSEDCASGDNVRVVQNRRHAIGGEIRVQICGTWDPIAEPNREAIVDMDPTQPITISWETMKQPGLTGQGFFMRVCSSGC